VDFPQGTLPVYAGFFSRTKSKTMFRKNFTVIPAVFMLLFVSMALLFTACPQLTDSSPGWALEAPVNTAVIGGDRKLTVSWNAVQSADSYDIYVKLKGEDENPPSTAAMSVTGFSGIINKDSEGTALVNGNEYYVWVRARNSTGASGYGVRVSGIPFSVPFAGYYRSVYGDGIEINNGSFSAYDNESKTVSYAGTIVYNDESSKILIIKITDAGTWEKTAGYYYAIAYEVNGANVSASSATSTDWAAPVNKGLPTLAEARSEYTAANGYFDISGDYVLTPTPPAAPVVAGINGKLIVSWEAVPGADEYELYMGIGDTIPGTATVTVATSFAELSGTNGTSYNVWIKTVRGTVKSDFSPPATGKPNAFVIPFAGYYKDPNYSDGFEISDDSFYAYGDGTKTLSYAGTVVENVQSSSNSGVLIIRITIAGSWGKTVGSYYGIAYQDFSGPDVKESSATSADWTAPVNNGLPSLAEAVAEYTVANGYYGYFGSYTKQSGIYLGTLEGNWANPSDITQIVTIGGDTYTYTNSSVQYGGTIIETTPFFETAGIIYIRLTSISGSSFGTAGQYYAIAWRNKCGKNIEFASANAQGYADLNEAKNNLVNNPVYSLFTDTPLLDLGFLKGSWSTEDDDYESFVVITNYSYAQYTMMEDPGYLLFSGTIEEITDTTATHGFIYIKYSSLGNMGDWEDCDPGKYYAIRWINNNDGTITLIPAYKYSGVLEKDTLAGAKAEFTVAAGYFTDDEAVFEPED
jgi:hypothetical protein